MDYELEAYEDDYYDYSNRPLRVYDNCSCDERYTCRKCLQKM
mgnify:FL=1